MGFWNSRHNWARISAKYRNDKVMRDLQRRRNAYYDALNMKIGLCVAALFAIVAVTIAILTPPETFASFHAQSMTELFWALSR